MKASWEPCERTALKNSSAPFSTLQILQPLCQHLETDLRLQAHSHLQLDDRNPFKVGLGDASAFLALPPIQFLGGKYIHVKARVETYLQKTFYNLTTVALHNWRTYGEMRALATHKYKVHLIKTTKPIWLQIFYYLELVGPLKERPQINEAFYLICKIGMRENSAKSY